MQRCPKQQFLHCLTLHSFSHSTLFLLLCHVLMVQPKNIPVKMIGSLRITHNALHYEDV